ncbi:MAG: hypothetical protein IPI67_12550 [Myxococcales bacterium]|nr:hypothetical protein [Myxococcales bacterium]
MKKMKGFRFLAGPALIAAMALPFGGGCDAAKDAQNATECAAELKAKAEAFQGAVNALVTVSGEMKASLSVACANIAKDLGETPPDVGDGKNVSDDDLKAACNKASVALDAKIKASGSVTLSIEGGKCEVNAQAQFSCEGKCDVSGKCEPPKLELRCDPGELSGQCSGECKASATCEGSATVAANCEGTCSATCTGTCAGTCTGKCDGADSSGTCAGKCEGKCDTECKGTCSGECKLSATAKVNCGAEASCKGGCSVEYTAPKCEGELKPLECDIDADCKAGCSGQGSLTATCTPPKVVVQASGDATLSATLEANLPAILDVAAKGELAGKAAADIAVKAADVGAEVAASAACAVTFGADFVAQLQASVAASASVSVSVSASASASGSATGSGGA